MCTAGTVSGFTFRHAARPKLRRRYRIIAEATADIPAETLNLHIRFRAVYALPEGSLEGPGSAASLAACAVLPVSRPVNQFTAY